jgi:hypothetical protein
MTHTTPAVEAVIKTDVLGRMRTSVERRESLLAEFEKSGLSGKKFAELAGIKYQTLATWLQKRRKQGRAIKAGHTMKWLEAVVEQAQNPVPLASSSVVLRLPGGTQIELGDVKQIPLAASLVRELARPC